MYLSKIHLIAWVMWHAVLRVIWSGNQCFISINMNTLVMRTQSGGGGVLVWIVYALHTSLYSNISTNITHLPVFYKTATVAFISYLIYKIQSYHRTQNGERQISQTKHCFPNKIKIRSIFKLYKIPSQHFCFHLFFYKKVSFFLMYQNSIVARHTSFIFPLIRFLEKSPTDVIKQKKA